MNEGDISIKPFVLAFAAAVLFLLICCSQASAAQVWNDPSQTSQQMTVPVRLSTGGILIDNFEYWDSPRNHGWMTNEPAYPVWGYGIGYGDLATILDYREGSRVLDVSMPASVFLPNIQRFSISKEIFNPDSQAMSSHLPLDPNNAYLSFKIRAPLAIENFASFCFMVMGDLSDGTPYVIRLIPKEVTIGDSKESFEASAALVKGVHLVADNDRVIEVKIGRQYADQTWHTAYVDLTKVIRNVLAPLALSTIYRVTIEGNQYRLDDIAFMKRERIIKEEIHRLGTPYLFKIGPLFPQLFTHTQRLIFAEDHTSNIYDIITNPDGIRAAWREDGVDPNTKDLTIPVVRDVDTRRSAQNHTEDMLRFNAFVGSSLIDSGSLSPMMITPLPVDTNDSMPGFLPSYGILADEFFVSYYHQLLVTCDPDGQGGDWCIEADDECVRVVPHEIGAPFCSEGVSYYPPERVRLIELALKNAGYQYWPNIAVLQFTPQYLEDLVVTVEVSDGLTRDAETFPVSVVNYPMENYPPLMEDLDDQIGYVNETFTYPITAIDPDSSLYSPTHPRQDQFILTWSATIAGQPNYSYGPWQEPLINPYTGLLRFAPQFEGNYHFVITVRDDRGFSSTGRFTLYCVNSGTWQNHPPVAFGSWDGPQICRAGELLVLDDEIDVKDPDGEKVYFSCTLGSIGTNSAGKPIWSFQTQFPGFYVSDIVAMDAHGAYTTFPIYIEVRPWWSI